MGSSSRLWNALYRSEYWYVKNSRYLFLLQWKIERGELKIFYNIIADIQLVLKIWKIAYIEKKVVIFKTTVISKIVFQAFITTVPKHIVYELKKNIKGFFLE